MVNDEMKTPPKWEDETHTVFKNVLAYVGSCDPAEMLKQLGVVFNPLEWELRDVANDSLFRAVDAAPGPWHDHFLLVFDSMAQAREVLPLLTVEGVAKRISVMFRLLADAALPIQPHIPILSSGQSLHVYVAGSASTHAIVDINGETWTSIHKTLASVVGGGPADLRNLPANGIRMGITNLQSSAWALGDPLARWVDPEITRTEVPPVESIDFNPEEAFPLAGSRDANQKLVLPSSVHGRALPPIDPFIISPSGFNPFPSYGEVDLELGYAGSWKITHQGEKVGQGIASLHEGALSILRKYWSVNIKSPDEENNWFVARLMSQLSAAGVPIGQFPKDPELADLLGHELFSILGSASEPACTVSDRESWSIRVRRETLRNFLPGPRLAILGLNRQLGAFEWPNVSIVVASMRPAFVPQILKQIARQSYKTVEVILALHGVKNPTDALKSSIDSFPGNITCLFFDKELSFGEVLNRACHAASGELVTKMDDDDWYGESHIMDLVLSRQYSGATLVGSPIEFVFLGGLDITVRRSHFGERYTNHVAGGTMMLSKNDLGHLGGWREISSAVDRGLIDAVLSSGNSVYRTHGQNYVMHRRSKIHDFSAHTWNADVSVFLRDLKEQWDGLVLPPEFIYRNPEYHLDKRSDRYQSLFSNEIRD